MFKLDCSSCGENFIRMADLRKHTLLQHYGGTGQQGVKRKSIFDGIEMDKRNSKEARRSFLLVFTCNFCPDKFTRLGDFKKHQIVHDNEERAEVTDVTDESDNTDDEEVENGIARFALKKNEGQGSDGNYSDDSESDVEESVKAFISERVRIEENNKRQREVEDITLAEDISEDVSNQTIFNNTIYSSQTLKSQAAGPPGPPQPVLRKTPPGPPISFQKSSSISTKPSFGLLPSGKQGAWYDCCTARLSTHPDFEKPFSRALQDRLLASLDTPTVALPGYQTLPGATPTLRQRSRVKLGGETFHIEALRGEGGFAKVFSASWQGGDEEQCVLKVQRPANDWEWHILGEVAKRVNKSAPHLSSSYMTVSRCFTFSDGSVLVSKLAPLGSLLDLINVTNKDKTIAEPLALHLTAEILELVHQLHLMDLIHADLKPDNFLVTDLPGLHNRALQMIDFGKALDMQLIPEHTVFTDQVSTSGLRCVEMRERRPWRHHIDYFGVAATVYCLLIGKYLKVKKSKSTGRWEPRDFKPRRGWQGPFWQNFFDTLLNLEGGEKKCLPNLLDMAERCREAFKKGEGMQKGLDKARELLVRRTALSRRRTL